MFVLFFPHFSQKGFPTDATLDDIKEWLDDKGQILNIQMRRTLHKTFKVRIFDIDFLVEKYHFKENLFLFYRGQYLLCLIVFSLQRSLWIPLV